MPNFLPIFFQTFCIEIITLASAVDIDPAPIEARIKEELPMISNCMVCGNAEEFLTVLLTVKVSLSYDGHGQLVCSSACSLV